jgi:predicted dehydrogenase
LIEDLPMKRKKVVMGVVGAGGISSFHFRAFAETKMEVRVIADPNRAAAEPYLERFGAAYATSFREVVEHPDVTAVCVCAPSPVHYEICAAALKHGKDVICEKTLTVTARDSLALARLARKHGRILYTNYMKRFFPAVRKAKEIIPTLGHLTSVYCRTYQGCGTDMHTGEVPAFFAPGQDGVSGIKKMAGGGILVCGGSHVLDLLLHLVGKPTAVYGRRFMRKGMDVDFMFHGLLDLPGGAVGHLECNWHPLTKIGYEARGWDEGFEITGVQGRLVLQTPVWNQPENNAAVLRHYDNRRETWTDYALPVVHPFVEAEKHFLSQLSKGQQGPLMDRYAGYRVDQLIETLWNSAGANRPLPVRWQDE